MWCYRKPNVWHFIKKFSVIAFENSAKCRVICYTWAILLFFVSLYSFIFASLTAGPSTLVGYPMTVATWFLYTASRRIPCTASATVITRMKQSCFTVTCWLSLSFSNIGKLQNTHLPSPVTFLHWEYSCFPAQSRMLHIFICCKREPSQFITV
jgi:hypothetical protein